MPTITTEELLKPAKKTITTEELLGPSDPVYGRAKPKTTPLTQRMRPVLEGTMRLEDVLPEDNREAVSAFIKLQKDPQGWRDKQVAKMLLADTTGMDPELIDLQFDTVTESVLGKRAKPAEVIDTLSPYPRLPQIMAAPEPGFFSRAWSKLSEKMGFLPDTGYYEGTGRFSKAKSGLTAAIGDRTIGLRLYIPDPVPASEKQSFSESFKKIPGAAKTGAKNIYKTAKKTVAGGVMMQGDVLRGTGLEKSGQTIYDFGAGMAQSVDEYYSQHPEDWVDFHPERGILGTTWMLISEPDKLVQVAVENAPYIVSGLFGKLAGLKLAMATKAGAFGKAIYPAVGEISAMGAQTFGTTYADRRAAGAEPMEAFSQAAATAAIEGALEKWTLDANVKVFKGAAGKATLHNMSQMAADMALAGGKSYGRGFVQEYSQAVNANFWQMLYADDQVLEKDFFQRLTAGAGTQAAVGGVLEPFMTGGFALLGAGSNDTMRQQAINGWKLVSDREKFNILDNLKGFVQKSASLGAEQKREIFSEIEGEKADILAGKYRDRGVSAVEMEFQKQAKEAFGIDDKQAAAWMAMVQARAVTKGMTPEEYLQQHIAGIQAGDSNEFSSPSSEAVPAVAGTALSQVGTGKQGESDILYQEGENTPIFNSKLRAVVDEKMGGAMEADTLLAMLKNSGVKDEEIAWSGLGELIESKKIGSTNQGTSNSAVSNTPVTDGINNKIHVSIHASEPATTDTIQQSDLQKQEKSVKITKQEVLDAILSQSINIKEVTKTEKWVHNVYAGSNNTNFQPLDGDFESEEDAQNYIDELRREEVELVADELEIVQENDKFVVRDKYIQDAKGEFDSEEEAEDALDDIAWKIADERWVYSIRHAESYDSVKYAKFTQSGGENYKELLLTLPGEQTYRSNHFDEKNILAHVRFNERVDTEGNRVLFIEEIQSDWHQAGREKGYQQAASSGQQNIEAVPDAPFKKNWHELAFKRMLRWAAENGFDKVAWTSGVQQVRRYENAMRQQVDRIDMVKTGEDSYAIIAAKGKNKVSENRNLTAQQAREQIGKVVFDKLDAQIQSGAAIATVQGDDLTVGGEGMKGFYDKILPEFAKKYVKKWGAAVGTTQIQTEGKKTETVHAVDVTDAMVDSVMAGQWLFQEDKLSGRQKAARKRSEARAGDTLGASIRDKMVADYAAAVAESGEYQAFIEGMTNIITQIVLKGNIGKIDFGSLTTEAMEYIEGKGHLKKYVAKPGEDGQAFDEVMDAINAEGEQGEQHGNAGGTRVSVDSPMELLELLDLYETGGKSGAELHAGAVQSAAGSDDPVTWLMANIYRRLKGGEDEATIQRFIADSVAGLNDSGAGLKAEDFWDIGGRKLEARKKQIKKSVKKAATEFLKDGKVILHAFEAADFSSLVHETAHLFRRELEPELLRAAEEFCGVDNGQWTVAAEEKFARSFERYLWEGKTANQQLRSIFAKFREWLRRIYLSLKDSPIDIRLSDDIKRVFDKMIAGPAEIHPGEMTFDEFYARLGKELEDYGSGWMERYGLQTRETPHQMHTRLKKEWAAMQASSTLGEKMPKDYLGSLTVEQAAQLEEIEKAAAEIPSVIWQQESARQVGDLIAKSNADELVVMEVQKQLKKAFDQGQKVGAERQKDYLKELLRRVKARKVLREHIRRLAKQIAAPVPGTVDLFEREAIAAMQAGFDPSFRMAKTLNDRERIRSFLARYPDKQMPRTLFETINKKALNELTIKDIEEMAHQRAKLEKQGKLKAKLKAEQDQRRIETITGQIIAAVEAQTKIRDKSVKPDAVDPSDITLEKAGVEKGRPLYWLLYKGQKLNEQPRLLKPGEKEETLKQEIKRGLERPTDKPITASTSKKHPVREWVENIKAATLTPERILDALDGGRGRFDGPAHRAFYDAVNQATDAKLRMVESRINAGQAKLKELGLTVKDLATRRMINEVEYATEEIIGIYGYAKNFKSRLAIQFGNRISQKTLIDAIDLCERQEPRLGELADWMMRELDGHFDRLENAMIEIEGRRLNREENYLPMRRQELDYQDHQKQTLNELKERYALKKAFAQKGFTISREDIPPECQKPIRLDVWSLWMEHVDKEEHFIHLGKLAMDLHKIAGSKDLAAAVEERFGKKAIESVRNYVSRVANPNIYKAYGFLASQLRSVRSNLAVSYMAGNLVTLLNQPSALLYYLGEAGPGHLMAAVADYVRHPFALTHKVWGLDPQVKYTVLDRALEEIKLAKGGKLTTSVKRVSGPLLQGIYYMDQTARVTGWWAVYQRALAEGKAEDEAIRLAQNATLRTQQAAAAKNVPELYAGIGGGSVSSGQIGQEVINGFLMFTNQLNKIYNIATYDIPAQWKDKQYGKAMLSMTGMMAAAAMIWAIGHRRLPEDEHDLLDICSEQALSLIPLIGNQMMIAKRGFGGSGSPLFDEVRDVSDAMGDILTGKGDEKDVVRLLESIAALYGIPTIGPKRVYRAVENGDLQELIGGKPRE